MRKILYIFAVLSFFATVTCYGQGDSCLKLLRPIYSGDTTWVNPDSIMVDSCLSSTTFGQSYGKGWFYMVFSYHILPTPVGAEDTIMYRTWQDIDPKYSNVRLAFDSLEGKYGTFLFRKRQPEWSDTSSKGSNMFDIAFDNYVNIDSVTIVLKDIPLAELSGYDMRAGIVFATINNKIQKFEDISILPNPASNFFSLIPSDKTISGQVSVRIFDQRGVVVASESVDISLENKINVSSLASGVYQVYCNDAKVGSLVIQR